MLIKVVSLLGLFETDVAPITTCHINSCEKSYENLSLALLRLEREESQT